MLPISPALANGGGGNLKARLRGSNEVPNAGDPDGKGSAVIRLRPTQGKICYKYEVEKVATLTAAHIHTGSVGIPGPVAVALPLNMIDVNDDDPTEAVFGGCVNVAAGLIGAIRANPANYYVNVHNASFPAGALRGQLHVTD